MAAFVCGQFPFVVMTSNGEREFPTPFLRRCVRLAIEPPSKERLAEIVGSHLKRYAKVMNQKDVDTLIDEFDRSRRESKEVATDQLLNAVFLTVAMRDAGERSFDPKEIETLRANLMRQLSGPNT
jgi:MoxR-like ATPase